LLYLTDIIESIDSMMSVRYNNIDRDSAINPHFAI
jgi:hypothetical protein